MTELMRWVGALVQVPGWALTVGGALVGVGLLVGLAAWLIIASVTAAEKVTLRLIGAAWIVEWWRDRLPSKARR